jgi:ribonuclease-3
VKSPGAWSRKNLGYEFSDPELLSRALTHKSYSAHNNERLEFLGDSVVGYVIADALYRQEHAVDEGVLTRYRASLVRGPTLADIGRELELGSLMRLGSGEARAGDHQRDSIIADGLEAIFGAILLDGGIEAAREVILRLYSDRLAALPGPESLKDPKSRLQEYLQADGLPVPDYLLEEESGPAHEPHFVVSCRIADHDIATRGEGSSRRTAEQEAATKALLLLGDE